MLIVPFAFCQEDVLELLEKTPEGAEVLNNLFIQSKLMGNTLSANNLRGLLNWVEQHHLAKDKRAGARHTQHKAACKADKAALKLVHKDNVQREFAYQRQVNAATRAVSRAKAFSSRAHNELSNYKRFEYYASQNLKEWNTFHASTLKNFQNILAAVKQIQKVYGGEQGAEFVELPAGHEGTFAQLKSDIERINGDDVAGLGPVMNNLLEMAVTKVSRGALRATLRGVRNYVQELIEFIEEEHEHHTALFTYLAKSFHKSVKRSVGVAAVAKAGVNGAQKAQAGAEGHLKTAKGFTQTSKKVLRLRRKECRQHRNFRQALKVRFSKIKAVVRQLSELLVWKFSKLKNYFLQKEMREQN